MKRVLRKAARGLRRTATALEQRASESPFGTNLRGDRATYLALYDEARGKSYPKIDELEARYGYAIDGEWLDELALHTQIVIKKSGLNYQHGRLLYSVLRDRIARIPEGTCPSLQILETGTARGFSALCMARALADSGVHGAILTVDVLPHDRTIYWNCIDDHEGPRTRRELLTNYRELLRYIIFLEGSTRDQLPRLGVHRVHFAFLDAAHSFEAVMTEFQFVQPRQCPGDVIVFDDVSPSQFPGVVRAIEAIRSVGTYTIDVFEPSKARGYAVATRSS